MWNVALIAILYSRVARSSPLIVYVQRRGADVWHKVARCTRRIIAATKVATWPHCSSSSRSTRSRFSISLLLLFFFLDHESPFSTEHLHVTRSHCSTAIYLKCHNVLTPCHYVCMWKCTIHTQSIDRRIYRKNSFNERFLSWNSIHILSIISSMHFLLPTGILMHMHQCWL